MRARTVALISVCVVSFRPAPAALPAASPNDNRIAAGVTRDGSVLIELDARRVLWHPDGDSLPGRITEAFAERGMTPVIPGPLVRVRVGTPMRFQLRNAELQDTLRLIVGAGAASDTLVVPPGRDGVLHYTPTVPGNYYYRAVTNDVQSNFFSMKGLLGGAFIVDSASSAPRTDRVLVVNWLVDSLTPDKKGPNFDRVVFAVNGRSWPHTERFTATVGDTIRWRVINLNQDPHPFHLHGVYFRVDDFSASPQVLAAKGPAGRMAVTELMCW